MPSDRLNLRSKRPLQERDAIAAPLVGEAEVAHDSEVVHDAEISCKADTVCDVVLAEPIHDALIEDLSSAAVNQEPPIRPSQVERRLVDSSSWIFRAARRIGSGLEWLLGCAAIVVGLAIAAAIPIVQFATLGYLLECAGRIGRSGRLSAGFVGIRKAARIGSIVAGTWICLAPLQYVSSLDYAAYLIDPGSPTTRTLWGLQIGLTMLIVPHILAAWYCGGRLRHFFWPFVAPFSLGLWLLRKGASSRAVRPLMNATLGWLSPRLVEDLCRARPISDWFLPAMLLEGLVTGRLYPEARDKLWSFVTGLRLPHYFWLGLRGFAGSVAWLIVPTLLLIGGVMLPQGAGELSVLIGLVAMSLVLMYIPFAQAHFATEGRLDALFDLGGIRRAFKAAPLLHALGLLILLLFALPPFLLKIEPVPTELLWLPGIAFLIFIWPARILTAWAYAKGRRRDRPRRWLTRWTARLSMFPLCLAFSLILFASQYVASQGSASLLEHHAVLVPAPFIRLPF